MRSLRFWLLSGIAVGVICLVITARYVEVDRILAALGLLRLKFALLASAGPILFVYIKSWRWTLLLSPLCKLRTLELVPAVFSGSAVNLVVPHAGEIARVMVIRNRQNAPASALLASIAVERLFDFAAVLGLLGLVALLESGLPPALISASYATGALGAAILLGALFLVHYPTTALGMIGSIARALPAGIAAVLLRQAELGISGLSSLRHAHILAKVMLISLLQWSTIAASILCSVYAVGGSIPPTAALAVLGLLIVGLTLPAAPVQVGTTQVAFALGLTAFQVDSSTSIAASVVYTLFGLVPTLAIGAVHSYRLGFSTLSNVRTGV